MRSSDQFLISPIELMRAMIESMSTLIKLARAMIQLRNIKLN